MFLTNLSLKRPVLATVMVLIPVTFGIMSIFTIGVGKWPEVEVPFISVTVVYPGASPETLENDVVKHIEEAMAQVPGVEKIFGTIKENYAIIWAEMTLETDVDVAAQDMREKIGMIRHKLPEGVEEPIVAKFDPMAFPVISFVLSGEASLLEKSKLANDLIKERLQAVSGVGTVRIYGDIEEEIHVELDRDRLAAYRIAVSEVISALERKNIELASGNLRSGATEISIRTLGKVEYVEELNNIAIAYRGGRQIYLKDVADISVGIEDRLYVCLYQGRETIGIDIIKQSGENTLELVDRVKKEAEKIQKLLPEDVKLEIVKDASVGIRNTVNDVLFKLILGVILTTLIVFIFLRSFRSTIIVAISIPFSMIATVFMMKIMDFTLNTMTLLALSIAIGLLIDDAIVVIENIKRHLDMGKTPLAAARDATKEVGMAVLATTWVVIAVFFPIAMMTGLAGIFFEQFGFTMIFAICFSLFMAFTLIPMLSSKHLKRLEGGEALYKKVLKVFDTHLNKAAESYVRLLKVALRFRIVVLICAFGLFVSSLLVVPQLGKGFIPEADIGEFSIIARLDSGLSLEKANQKAKKIEDLILSFPEVTKCYLIVDKSEVRGFVQLVDKDERERSLDEITSLLRQEFRNIPGVQLAIIVERGLREEEEILLYLQGPDIEKLREYAWEIKRIMEEIPGAVDISSSYKPGKPEISIDVDHERATDLGVSSAHVAYTIKALFDGVVVTQFDKEDEQIDIRLRLSEDQRKDINDLEDVYLLNTHGRLIALEQVADIEFETKAGEISRYNRSKSITIRANLEGIPMGEFNELLDQKMSERIKKEEGYQLARVGDVEDMQETFQVMTMAMLTATLFIFLVLAAQFESYLSPLAVMFTIPLAITGGILGLFVAGSELSLISMIGMVLLLGIAAKNGVLLIEFVQQGRQKGMAKDEALLSAARLRFRPIMMTSIALVISMVPLALALGHGGEQRSPMAHAIIGGMLVSTLLTLFVVPAMYSLLDSARNKAMEFLFKRQEKAASGEN
ncbi:efflux RND transporter permease subunit [Peptococcaceae bacterium]|nr:efflux RND transporter permease subunit [Peptococcaceae bacterium]